MELGYILRRAWRITWEHKALWLFGFLVSTGLVGTGVGVTGLQWERLAQELPPEAQRVAVDLLDVYYSPTANVVLAVVGFVVGVGLILLGALGRAALVNQARSAEDYDVVVLKGGWLTGKRHLWQVFFIRLLLGLPVVAVALVGALPSVVTILLLAWQEQVLVQFAGVLAAELLLLVCLVPALCLAALLTAPLEVLQRLAVRVCVLDACGVRRSVARAWTMLREHLGWLALVWLIQLLVAVGVVLLVGLPLALAAGLLLLAAWLTTFLSPPLSVALTLVVGLLAWLAAIVIVGVVETFFSTVWTLAYRELTGMGLTGEEKEVVA